HTKDVDRVVVNVGGHQPSLLSKPKAIASVPSSSVPATNVVMCTGIPSWILFGSGSMLTRLVFTEPPPSRSTVADTYGVGTPGAARCTIVKLRTTPSVPSFSEWKAR